MSPTPHSVHALLGLALAVFSMLYGVFACAAVRTRRKTVAFPQSSAPAVTLLKPLCGAEAETYDCLKSFCLQDYPAFQIVFGVSDAQDPSIPIVLRLQQEFTQLDLRLVVDAKMHGTSRKVSNLINMMPRARHDLLVMSDSDVRVERDYLSRLLPRLLEPDVGIVTCAYRGIPGRGFWSVLGAMYINEWFIPSVRVAALGGSREFAFGATIAVRRQCLARIGGFAALADHLADDYRLGEMTRQIGLRTVLSDVEVETFVVERSLTELVRHELRWLRTIRALRPTGYAFSFVTFGVPIAFLGAFISGWSAPACTALAVTAVPRVLLHLAMRRAGASIADWLALPIRDWLTFALWLWSYSTRCVQWRESRYRIARDGRVLPILRT